MPLIEIVQNKGLPITGGPLFCGGSLKGNILALTKINQGFAMHQIFWAYARLDLHQQKQNEKRSIHFKADFFMRTSILAMLMLLVVTVGLRPGRRGNGISRPIIENVEWPIASLAR